MALANASPALASGSRSISGSASRSASSACSSASRAASSCSTTTSMDGCIPRATRSRVRRSPCPTPITPNVLPRRSKGVQSRRASASRTARTGRSWSSPAHPIRGGFLRVYLDAPTGRVLDVTQGVDFIGWMHSFHESLTLREYMGREIVGFVGVAMLISSLSGIYLWWPARGQGRKALGFRKGFGTVAQPALHVRLLRFVDAGDDLLHRHVPVVHRCGARGRRRVRPDLAFAARHSGSGRFGASDLPRRRGRASPSPTTLAPA